MQSTTYLCLLLLLLIVVLVDQTMAFSNILRNSRGVSNLIMQAASQRVMVVGATGRTGQRIVKQLCSADANIDVRCLVRSESVTKATDLFTGIKNVQIESIDDLVSADVSVLTDKFAGCDTVVCAVGALESEVFNVKAPYQIDGKLSQKVVDAAKQSGSVKHMVLVTSLGTDRIGFPASILNLFWGVLSWKRQTELKLISSGLKYTIVRPGGMEKPTDEFENTHNMKLHLPSTKFGGLVSRKQISQLCAAAVLQPELASNRILEVTADPDYPKLTATQLLEQLPKEISDTEWRARLSEDQFYILREAGTERPWTSPLNAEKRLGMFTCGGCGAELFPSTTKFESGTGWPSFYAPARVASVNERSDFMLGNFCSLPATLSATHQLQYLPQTPHNFPCSSLFVIGMVRTEVLCSSCGGHLGHVFPDGPKPTGQRYCINGAALQVLDTLRMTNPICDTHAMTNIHFCSHSQHTFRTTLDSCNS